MAKISSSSSSSSSVLKFMTELAFEAVSALLLSAPTSFARSFISCFLHQLFTSRTKMDPCVKAIIDLISLSEMLSALISKKPRYFSGKLTWCSWIFLTASSNLVKKVLQPSSFWRLRWYVNRASEDKSSSSRSSPNSSGVSITSSSLYPFFSSFNHDWSLA